MKTSLKIIFASSLVIIGILFNSFFSITLKSNQIPYTFDLPEEISQANKYDTLLCVKHNDTLIIYFNNYLSK